MARWKGLIGSAVSAVDRAVVVAMQMRSAADRARTEKLGHDQRLELLANVHRAYGGQELVADAERYFTPPKAIDPSLRFARELVTRSRRRARVWDAEWQSTFEPYLADVAEQYMSRVENRTARARLYFGDGGAPRPAVIALHGYMGGHLLFEEIEWPIPWLVQRGLDVALPVLPFHALRAGARRGAPLFPSADPRLTNEGFRQAVADVVALARWLRARGAPHVGVMGMSLGGYTSALVATVSRDVDFVMPLIPLASIADFAREQGRLGVGERAAQQHAALERANWIVSPLARPLLMPPSRALVVAAEHDRITPQSHARRIATHFDCTMVTISGGHLLQIGRATAFRALFAMLERDAVIEAARRAPR